MYRPKVHGWKNKCSFPSSHIPTPTRRPSSYIPTPTHRTEKRDKAPCSVSSPTPALTSPASVTLLHFACFPCSSCTCCKGPRWSLRQPHRRGARGLDAVTPAAVPETPVCSPPHGLARTEPSSPHSRARCRLGLLPEVQFSGPGVFLMGTEESCVAGLAGCSFWLPVCIATLWK